MTKKSLLILTLFIGLSSMNFGAENIVPTHRTLIERVFKYKGKLYLEM